MSSSKQLFSIFNIKKKSHIIEKKKLLLCFLLKTITAFLKVLWCRSYLQPTVRALAISTTYGPLEERHKA